MGDWYVNAHVPHFAEAGAVGSVETYALRTDNTSVSMEDTPANAQVHA